MSQAQQHKRLGRPPKLKGPSKLCGFLMTEEMVRRIDDTKRKLGVSNRTDAVRELIELGLQRVDS